MESVKRPVRRTGSGGARGFTLIEVLVALAIAGIVSATLVVLAFPGDAGRAQNEARRLAALLELASTEARTTGQRLAWAPDPAGYAFWRIGDDGEWTRFPESSVYRPRALEGQIALRSVQVDSRPLRPGGFVPISPYGNQALIEATIVGGNARFILRGGILGRISLQRETGNERSGAPDRLHAG